MRLALVKSPASSLAVYGMMAAGYHTRADQNDIES